MDERAVRDQVQELDERLAALQALPDDEAREQALAAVGGLLALYGEGLRRMVAVLQSAGAAALEALSEDELVSHLLLLHDLHPRPVGERVLEALEEVRPYLGSHGGGIELVELADGVARVRLQGSCHGCAASTATLRLAVEEAVLRAAPELHAVEEVGEAPPALAGLALPMFEAGAGSPPPTAPPGRWVSAGPLAALDGAVPQRVAPAGAPMLVARAGGELYAYHDRCPACQAPLAEPRVEEGALRCGGCGRRYDLRRAGVGVDGGLLSLEPVPLLVRDGEVQVAVEAVPA